jgi:dethiobiotin synthetase
MKNTLFIAGTDTGVGKTWVTCQLIRQSMQRQESIHALKPIGSGSTLDQDGIWRHPDTFAIAKALNLQDESQVTYQHFSDPVAPSVASHRQGTPIDFERLVNWTRSFGTDQRRLIIEGVGGLLCPLTDRLTMADFLSELDIPVLLVSRRSLGMLNHSLLTIEAMQTRKIKCVGLVVNSTEHDQSLASQTNEAELSRWIDIPIVGSLTHETEDQQSSWLDDRRIWQAVNSVKVTI